MACMSPDLDKTAGDSSAALEAIQKLEESVKQQNAGNIQFFESEIEKALKQARVKESRLIEFTSNVKTEYASEFSTDKIRNVVEATLKAVAAVKKAPAFSDDAIESYTNVVSVLSEAAKSRSASSSDMTFQYHRLMPGVLVFLYAKTTNLSDSKLFGEKTISSTVIYHKIIESPDDLKLTAAFDVTAVDASVYVQTKELQIAVHNDLQANLFSPEFATHMETYRIKTKFIEEIAQAALARLRANGYDTVETVKK